MFIENRHVFNIKTFTICFNVVLIILETILVNPDTLREKIRKSIASKDEQDLQNVIKEAELALLPEVSSDLLEARDTLESLGGGRGG